MTIHIEHLAGCMAPKPNIYENVSFLSSDISTAVMFHILNPLIYV